MIIVSGRHLRRITEDALKALIAANEKKPSIFIRAAKICRLRKDEHDRPFVELFNVDSLKGTLDRHANFFRETLGGLSPARPPVDVVKDILAKEDLAFPGIAGIVEVPVLRPDGTVFGKPGYDPDTRLYYWQKGAAPEVPMEPTPEQVREALALLDEAIGDFPFANAASKANALGLILTPIVRPAIPGTVPLALIDAPQQGTGKSLLASVISTLGTGRPAAMMPAPDNDEEWRKRITSTLMGGATIITIDNLEGRLESPSLASVVTADTWRDRILGKSDVVEIAQRATWMATGNNIALGGDLQRRCYWIRLDAKAAEPWRGRTFRHPRLIQWVKQHRPELLTALLTLARAWFAAGKPDAPTPVLGSFEEWSQVVGGVLSFGGVESFLGNLDELYAAADEGTAEWVQFLAALEAHFPEPFTTAALVREVELRESVLRDSLPAELADALARRGQLGGDFGKRLGKALKSSVKRRFRHREVEYRLEIAGDYQGAKLWRVVREAPKQPRAEDAATAA
jgi:hypothetical protein